MCCVGGNYSLLNMYLLTLTICICTTKKRLKHINNFNLCGMVGNLNGYSVDEKQVLNVGIKDFL